MYSVLNTLELEAREGRQFKDKMDKLKKIRSLEASLGLVYRPFPPKKSPLRKPLYTPPPEISRRVSERVPYYPNRPHTLLPSLMDVGEFTIKSHGNPKRNVVKPRPLKRERRISEEEVGDVDA